MYRRTVLWDAAVRLDSATGGLAVASASGGSSCAPIVLHAHLSVERIAVAPLSPDTVAQIVWFLHKSQIQVSDIIPRGMHAAVARHVTESHEFECIIRACPQARTWMAEFSASPSVAQSALPA